MNKDVLNGQNANRYGAVLLTEPKNGEEIELNSDPILAFLNGYKKGLSVEYAFDGDNYAPKPLRLAWKSSKVGLWVVYLDYNPDFTSPKIFRAKEQFLDLNVHFTERRIYWKVESEDRLIKSEISHFIIGSLPKTVFVDGVVNVRDIGGYTGLDGKKIKRGIIYRGAYLDGITDEGKSFVDEFLKIKVDLDLRNEGEGSADEKFSPLGENVRHVLRCGCMYTGNNWSGVEHVGKEGIDIPEGARKLVEELLVFADRDNFPLYAHCVLGRDRTGTVIALLLALCGVEKEDIMLDYELSFFSKSGTQTKEEALKIIGYFEKVIEHIETFKGDCLRQKTEDFLKISGMTEEQIIAIRTNVLE